MSPRLPSTSLSIAQFEIALNRNAEYNMINQEDAMSQTVILELPDDVIHHAQSIAEHSQQRIEDVLRAWIDQAAANVPLELLSNQQILALCDAQLSQPEQQMLSALLYQQREHTLDPNQKQQLQSLLQTYRHAMLRKAEALKVAVERGLRPALS